MSSKLKVQELRDALEKRGLDITGLKPALVSRLDAAIAEEQEAKKPQDVDGSNPSSPANPVDSSANRLKTTDNGERRKSSRSLAADQDDNNANASKRARKDDIENLDVAQLRIALAERGLSTVGNKKTLIRRLAAVLGKESEESSSHDLSKSNDKTVVEIEDEKSAKEEHIVVATQKGRAVLDNFLPDHIKSSCHVLDTGNEIYDAMLNQTNVGDNNNKFYVIQVLVNDVGSTYYVYNRWGRVGAKGQDKLFGPYFSKDRAISEFQLKFYDKTSNSWPERHSFKPHSKKYTWLERGYDNITLKDSETKEEEKKAKAIAKAPCESKLDKRLADFISCICSLSMMKQQMMEIGYDANKMPLGKLSKSTILKGYEALKKISAVLEGSMQGSLEQLSSEFYTVIPHDFGFQKMRNFIIDSPQKLKKKLEMVEALGEIELATKLLDVKGNEEEDDPAHTYYKRLNCHLEPLERDEEEFGWINQYVINTHGETHSSYQLEVLQIFKVMRMGEDERFKEFVGVKNRMLLWHGSRLTNWTGILSQGLRIAPPEAPVNGYMFGKGVYFADMISKSANYCCSSPLDPIGVLLLCEVALGEMRELLCSDYKADNLPPGKLSTKGVGATEPNPKKSKILPDGLIVPLGKPQRKGVQGALLYNEYIVYNVAQIRMRYLLQVKFKFN